MCQITGDSSIYSQQSQPPNITPSSLEKDVTSSSPLSLTKRRHGNNNHVISGGKFENSEKLKAQYGSTSTLEKPPQQQGPEREKVVLKRRVGLVGGVALIVGSIIGLWKTTHSVKIKDN